MPHLYTACTHTMAASLFITPPSSPRLTRALNLLSDRLRCMVLSIWYLGDSSCTIRRCGPHSQRPRTCGLVASIYRSGPRERRNYCELPNVWYSLVASAAGAAGLHERVASPAEMRRGWAAGSCSWTHACALVCSCRCCAERILAVGRRLVVVVVE